MKSTLTINDLSIDKELNEQSMSAVRGGSGSKVFGNVNFAAAIGGNGTGNAATALNVAPISSADLSSRQNLTSLTNIGGFMGLPLV